MRPLIAIPEPVSDRAEYNQRSLPQYVQAIEQAGGEARVVPLALAPDEAARIVAECDAVLLPGSPADLEPARYDAPRDPKSAPADLRREEIDATLLRDAYATRKPVLGICYGLQSLNVWRAGTLVQHVQSPINHEAGKTVLRAHKITVAPLSRLAAILNSGGETSTPLVSGGLVTEVNSSHHQAAAIAGEGLRAVATCPADAVVEALEGTSPEHFVLGVQWHPERTTDTEEGSRAIFRAFIQAAADGRSR